MKPTQLSAALLRIATYIEKAPAPSRERVLRKLGQIVAALEGRPNVSIYGVVSHGVDMEPEEAGRKAAAMLTAAGFKCDTYELEDNGSDWSAWLFDLPESFWQILEKDGEWSANDDEIMVNFEAP